MRANHKIFAVLALLFLAELVEEASSAYCNGKPKENAPENTIPVWSTAPKLVKTVKNGKLYAAGDPSGNQTMDVIHVWGDTPFEIGFAIGTLMKDKLPDFINQVFSYIEDQVIAKLPKWTPKNLVKEMAKRVILEATDLTYNITVKYTNPTFYEELHGIANATGIDYEMLRGVQLIGELTKGSCSMFGAWGPATVGGKTIQLRALDWDVDGPFWKFPSVTVYHLKGEQGYTHANIGFVGFNGMISGISENQMAVSEIGVSFPDSTFKRESRFGDPFTYVLREMMQFDKNLSQATNRLKTTTRTCDLLFGVGDGKINKMGPNGEAPKTDNVAFHGFELSHDTCNVYDDANLMPNEAWHPRLNHTVYWGMDWDCEPWNKKIHDLLQANYGKIDMETTKTKILGPLTSGNLQAVIYDLSDMKALVSYGYYNEAGKIVNAYESQYVEFDLIGLFAEKAPGAEEAEAVEDK